MRRDPTRYDPTLRLLHWVLAVAILVQLTVGMIMGSLPQPVGNIAYNSHKGLGQIVLVLMILRLVWRLTHPVPPIPLPAWQAGIARLNHWLLYITVLVMAVSGLLLVLLGGYPLPIWDTLHLPRPVNDKAAGEFADAVHQTVRWIVLALVTLHILAALRHAFRRDGVFRQML